jgi:hypothetical protein
MPRRARAVLADSRWRPALAGIDNAGMNSEVATGSDATRWTKSTVYPDMWVDPDDDPRETDVDTDDERGMLLDYLRYYRLTMDMKCAGLDRSSSPDDRYRRPRCPCSGWCGTWPRGSDTFAR